MPYSLLLNLILLLVGFFAYRYYRAQVFHAQQVYLQKYQQRHAAHFQTLPNQNGEILFVGDEWIEEGPWDELFQNPMVKNRGVRGNATEGVLSRVGELTESEPAKIFLLVGHWDLNQGLGEAEILKSYRQVLTEIKVKSPKTEIYAHSLLPVNPQLGNTRRTNAATLSLNQKLEALCAELDVKYLNIFDDFANAKVLNASYTDNGEALNGAGYNLWKNRIEKWVQTPSQKRPFLTFLKRNKKSPLKRRKNLRKNPAIFPKIHPHLRIAFERYEKIILAFSDCKWRFFAELDFVFCLLSPPPAKPAKGTA
ncbi:MAG: hypothetical protein HC913_12555 [Microscillaceae bacterium]|nr:hypothetical protein [Microscillaceae bacterium]